MHDLTDYLTSLVVQTSTTRTSMSTLASLQRAFRFAPPALLSAASSLFPSLFSLLFLLLLYSLVSFLVIPISSLFSSRLGRSSFTCLSFPNTRMWRLRTRSPTHSTATRLVCTATRTTLTVVSRTLVLGLRTRCL